MDDKRNDSRLDPESAETGLYRILNEPQEGVLEGTGDSWCVQQDCFLMSDCCNAVCNCAAAGPYV